MRFFPVQLSDCSSSIHSFFRKVQGTESDGTQRLFLDLFILKDQTDEFDQILCDIMHFIVGPIVLFSIMSGVISLKDIRKVESIGGITVVYSLTVRTLGGLSPIDFFKGMMPAILFAFSSASSVGTLPLNMECTEELGASKEVSSFVLPLGATINMDGTAIYQGVCAIFIASCYGIPLTLGQMVKIVLTATLASVGTAGVPEAGMIMLAMVLASVGLPIDGIALVAGVDRIFDMGRTTLNITGDASCAIIVSNFLRKKK